MGSNVVWEITFKQGQSKLMIVSPERDTFKAVEDYFKLCGNFSLITGIKRIGPVTYDATHPERRAED